jgi:hypothetical protein
LRRSLYSRAVTIDFSHPLDAVSVASLHDDRTPIGECNLFVNGASCGADLADCRETKLMRAGPLECSRLGPAPRFAQESLLSEAKPRPPRTRVINSSPATQRGRSGWRHRWEDSHCNGPLTLTSVRRGDTEQIVRSGGTGQFQYDLTALPVTTPPSLPLQSIEAFAPTIERNATSSTIARSPQIAETSQVSSKKRSASRFEQNPQLSWILVSAMKQKAEKCVIGVNFDATSPTIGPKPCRTRDVIDPGIASCVRDESRRMA